MQNILFDYARLTRTGLPESVFCEGKSDAAVEALLRRFARPDTVTCGEKKSTDNAPPPILFTRLAPEVLERMPADLQKNLDYDALSRTAFYAALPARPGSVAIVAAGTADGRVSHEAARTLRYLGIQSTMFEDVGVAGLWRLTERLEAINRHDAIIVVAGLDAALASVLGGLTPKPLFAVPTSVGYGAADGGKTALASMLVSCAPGLGVFNIDNGYGAACAAARVLNSLASKRL